jgi:cellulose synthase/poly-beta-1,6-N-acetylglucosamine synthase-like glycosyltransferase
VLIDVLNYVLTFVALFLLVPTVTLLIQVVVTLTPPSTANISSAPIGRSRPRVVVLVPAFDEASGIAASLRTMHAQLAPDDRLLVVADNCTDETASVAASAGAEVVVRRNAELRGKGYALDFGVRYLEAAPPEVVVIVDADCELEPGSLDRLARLCAWSDRPVQGLYLMQPPTGAGLKTRMAAFGWLLKNHVRPLSLSRLNLPCQLMGSGMALPWARIKGARLATGNLVEDMQLGLDMTLCGAPPLFCPEAQVTSHFPTNPQSLAGQHERWERGHIRMILHEAPSALWKAIRDQRLDLAAMVFDLCVPPPTILATLVILQTITSAVNCLIGGSNMPFWLSVAALVIEAVAIGLAWTRFGRRLVSLPEMLFAPLYLVGKLPLYWEFLKRGKNEWIRTRR